MSNIDTQHNVIPFVSGESKPLSGQRLARVLYKKNSEFPSVCVSVPQIPAEWCSDSRLLPHIGEWLEEQQDKVIKALYESRKGKLDRVSDQEIGIDAILGYLEGKAAGERISAESIGNWFTSYVQNSLIVVLAEKLGYGSDGSELTEDQMDTLLRECAKIRNILELMASKGGISYSEQQKRVISRCFDIANAPEDHGFTQKLKEKFATQCAAPKADVLDF